MTRSDGIWLNQLMNCLVRIMNHKKIALLIGYSKKLYCLVLGNYLSEINQKWRKLHPATPRIASNGGHWPCQRKTRPFPQVFLVGGLKHFLFFHILGILKSQLTFICFRGVGIPPTSIWVPSAHSAAWQAFFCCKNLCVGCYFLVYICQCGGCCIVKRSVLQPVDVREGCLFFRSAKDDWNVTAILGALGPSRFFSRKRRVTFSPRKFFDMRIIVLQPLHLGKIQGRFSEKTTVFTIQFSPTNVSSYTFGQGWRVCPSLKGFSLSNMTGRLGPLTVHC